MSKLLKLYIQKMIVVKGSNFVHSEQFVPIFRILIFYSSSFKSMQMKSEDQLAWNWLIFNVFNSFGFIDSVFILDIYFSFFK